MPTGVVKPIPTFVHARYLDLINQSLTTAGAFIAASTHHMLRNSRAQIEEGSTGPQVHTTQRCGGAARPAVSERVSHSQFSSLSLELPRRRRPAEPRLYSACGLLRFLRHSAMNHGRWC